MHNLLDRYKNYITFFILLFFLIGLKTVNPSFVKSISFLSFDLYQKIIPLKKETSKVVIVDIDEKSLERFGQFPWNRSIFTKITENINREEPKAIGFDIFFPEKDKQAPEEIIKAYNINENDVLNYLKNIESHDEKFRQKINSSNSVLAVLGSNIPSKGTYDRSAKAKFFSKGGNPNNFTYSFPYSIGSLEKLENSSKGLGSISFLDQSDGIIRSVPLIIQFKKKLYPTLGLEMIRVGSKQKNIFVELDEVGVKKLSVRPFKITSDANGLFWIRYKQSQKSQYISSTSVYDEKFEEGFFKDKYVLIGASAQGLFDLVKTPLGITIPGVEVHANVIENILNNSYLIRNPKVYIVELLFSIIIAFITFYFSQNIKPKYSLAIYFSSIISVILIGLIFFLLRSELIDISYPIFMVTTIFLAGLYFRFLKENALAISNLQKQAVLKKERELAGEVQKRLFPEMKKFEKFIYAKNVPARDVSGDYYDIIEINENEFYFTLADVSGKGVRSGMLMAKASSVFRTLANLSLPLEKIVFTVNNEIVEAKFKGMFVTAVFGRMNILSGEIEIINAGHESIMLVDKNKNFEFIKSDLPPIGIIKYPTEKMVKKRSLNIKDKIFMVYTDGVTEGYLKNGKELGVEGIKEIVSGVDEKNPINIIQAVVNTLNFDQAKLRDDITCLCIKIYNKG